MSKTKDFAADVLDKVSGPTQRSGHAAERAAKMCAGKVRPEVTALQFTINSANGYQYTPEFIVGLSHLFKDCKTRTPITARQATALINDQIHNGILEEFDFSVASQPQTA